MVERLEVEGYDEFCKIIIELESKNKDVYIYFTGSKNPNGDSWCPTCVVALPIVEKVISEHVKDGIILYVNVGDRPTWKDRKCPFRTDKRLKLQAVPTFMKWGESNKVVDLECQKEDLVKMIFEN